MEFICRSADLDWGQEQKTLSLVMEVNDDRIVLRFQNFPIQVAIECFASVSMLKINYLPVICWQRKIF